MKAAAVTDFHSPLQIQDLPVPAGRTQIIAVDRELDEVNESVDDALSGRIPARIVFQL